jgi:hypothetical protein
VSISLYFVVQWFEPRLLGRDGNRLSLNSSRDSASQVYAQFFNRNAFLYSHLMALICIWNFYYCQTVRLFNFLHVRKCVSLSKNFDNDFQSIWINFLSFFQVYFPLDTKFAKNLWVPDVYIYHLKYISRSLKNYQGLKEIKTFQSF